MIPRWNSNTFFERCVSDLCRRRYRYPESASCDSRVRTYPNVGHGLWAGAAFHLSERQRGAKESVPKGNRHVWTIEDGEFVDFSETSCTMLWNGTRPTKGWCSWSGSGKGIERQVGYPLELKDENTESELQLKA
jgi:hypothetical protein